MPWFPITDPAREADIRMRRRRAAMLLTGIVFALWSWSGGGAGWQARGHHADIAAPLPTVPPPPAAASALHEIAAQRLRIDLPCAGSVTILADPAFQGRAAVDAGRGGHPGLALRDGSISQSGACDDDGALVVRTGPATPLTLIQSGDNALHAGSFDAPVTVESSGSGSVTIDSSGPLTVRQRGSGDVKVGTVNGPLTALLQGSGALTVGAGVVPSLDATSSDSGDLTLDGVRLGGGKVVLDGSGDFSAGTVAGTFQATSSGSGDVAIDTADSDRLTLIGQGSGDILVRHGRIRMLQAVIAGSGDLTVGASVEAGTLGHHGSGDIAVPKTVLRTDG